MICKRTRVCPVYCWSCTGSSAGATATKQCLLLVLHLVMALLLISSIYCWSCTGSSAGATAVSAVGIADSARTAQWRTTPRLKPTRPETLQHLRDDLMGHFIPPATLHSVLSSANHANQDLHERCCIPMHSHHGATQTRLLWMAHAVKCRRQRSPCRRQQLRREALPPCALLHHLMVEEMVEEMVEQMVREMVQETHLSRK